MRDDGEPVSAGRRDEKTKKAIERRALRDAVVVVLVFALCVTIGGALYILLFAVVES